MRGQGRFLVGCMVAFGLLILLGGCSRGSARAILDLVPLQKQLVRVWVALELREEGFAPDTIGSATFAFERGELECGDS